MNFIFPPSKITMIRASLRCFAFGLLGLLPVIGLPFALAALWISVRAQVREKFLWNPARPYRILGTASAALGIIGWTFTSATFIYEKTIAN